MGIPNCISENDPRIIRLKPRRLGSKYYQLTCILSLGSWEMKQASLACLPKTFQGKDFRKAESTSKCSLALLNIRKVNKCIAPRDTGLPVLCTRFRGLAVKQPGAEAVYPTPNPRTPPSSCLLLCQEQSLSCLAITLQNLEHCQVTTNCLINQRYEGLKWDLLDAPFTAPWYISGTWTLTFPGSASLPL